LKGVKSTKQSVEAYVPVSGVAKPHPVVDEGVPTPESGPDDEPAVGTASNVYEYSLAGSVIENLTSITPTVVAHPVEGLPV
jgi:hypothetical protein